MDPIAALQDDEEGSATLELLEADPGTESGMTEEEDVSDSKFVAFAEATKEEFSSPQATRSIKEQTGNILYKFILQIPFFT